MFRSGIRQNSYLNLHSPEFHLPIGFLRNGNTGESHYELDSSKSLLVLKVSRSGKDHRYVMTVASGDHIVVAARSTRLNNSHDSSL